MATFPKMTLDQVIARLQDLRPVLGGDAFVAVRGYHPKDIIYVDAIGPVAVGKTNPHTTVTRGGVGVVKLYGQGE